MQPEARAAAGRPVSVLGVSLAESCGVRDHATLLAEGLQHAGIPTRSEWLTRRERSLAGSRAEISRWAQDAGARLAAERPRAVLLHYSVFTVSHKGVPLFLRPVLGAARAAGAPVAVVLHEFAYPWGYGGWRGPIWSVTQRAALIEVVRASAALMVTADERVRWLRSRRWLPRRPVLCAPVYSNLPAPRAAAPGLQEEVARIGLFGYSYEGAARELVLDSLVRLREQGREPALRLMGAPGPESPAGRGWRQAAEARGLAQAVSFSGRLPAQELSDALAACDVLIFADEAGPSSRKGTLAAALASGRPVVALDGPATWDDLASAGAVVLSAPRAQDLSRALAGLLEDPAAGMRVGGAGRAFYERRMSLERSVDVARELLAAAGAADAGAPAGGQAAVRSPSTPA